MNRIALFLRREGNSAVLVNNPYNEEVIMLKNNGSISGRIVINLCLSIDIAEAEDEQFCIIDAVEFRPEGLDF